MRSRCPVASRRGFLLAAAGAAAAAATRPRYGGTLRVELREAIESADPPQTGPGMAQLNAAFTCARWESGRRAVFTADENAAGGRAFLDAVDVQMGRPLRERAIELGRADLVELAPAEVRRAAGTQRIWSSSPVRLVALAFGPRVDDVRVRQALALAVDRAAIHNVLLQRQGEVSGALVPQWISGYAFLFPTAADVPRARALLAGVAAPARSLTLAAADRTMAERVALNGRDAGLALTAAPADAPADVRLAEVRTMTSDPPAALAAIAAGLDLPAPPSASASPEAVYAAERVLVESYRAIPLFHLPDLYAVGPRVRGGPGITPLGEWRFENLWVEGGRP